MKPGVSSKINEATDTVFWNSLDQPYYFSLIGF